MFRRRLGGSSVSTFVNIFSALRGGAWQAMAIASCSCNCVLLSSMKSRLNTAPKCSILRSNNKKISGEGSPRQLNIIKRLHNSEKITSAIFSCRLAIPPSLLQAVNSSGGGGVLLHSARASASIAVTLNFSRSYLKLVIHLFMVFLGGE